MRKGLLGQTDLCWEAAGDLRDRVSDEDFARGITWDVRLALALHEATSDPQVGGKFWHVYGRLLPHPHTVTVRRSGFSHYKKCPFLLSFVIYLPSHTPSINCWGSSDTFENQS